MRTYARSVLVITTILITGTYSLWYFSPSFAISAVEPVDVELGGRKILAMPGEVLAYHSLEQLRLAASNGEATLNRPVDFSRHKVVRVGWRAMGYHKANAAAGGQPLVPVVGHLTRSARSGGRQVYFHIQQPLQESTAGEAVAEIAHRQQMGESWFVVNREASVSYSEFARPIQFDLLVLLLMFVVAHVTVWPWVRRRKTQLEPAFEPAENNSLEWATGN